MSRTSNAIPAEPAAERECDALLRPFLEAPDEETAHRCLGALIQDQAAPLAWDVIRGHLRGPATGDLEDVHAGVLLRLAVHLRGLRTGDPGEPAIRSFPSYVAVVAHNACHAYLRQRAPQRARLRTRTRYVLTRDARLAFWEGGGRAWLCGLADRRGAAVDPRSAAVLADVSRRIAPVVAFPDTVLAVLSALPGPARFDDLVDALAAILGVADERPGAALRGDEDAPPLREVPDPAPPADEVLHQRSFLARLWTEIRALPPRQRVALLLNLRDALGRGMIGLFPITETASMAELAVALEMPEPRLREIWDELPRDDEWIAALLGLTRRQVINLRKCARERLGRRLRRDGW